MSLLTSAIRAELEADYRRAVGYYRRLASQGSPLDRIGIFQAIARCYEKVGVFGKAAYWHERAGQGYTILPNRVMGGQERAYYALIEYRSALQDYRTGPGMRRTARLYLNALNKCLKAGKEGYSHEMLFAGHLSAKLGLTRRAANFFMNSANQFKNEAKTKLAHEMYAMAAISFEKAGDSKMAKKAHDAGANID